MALWFAWKIVLLQYHKQHHPINHRINKSCDLLEKSYFCSITNNTRAKFMSAVRVVICLKNRTFAVSQTTLVSDIFANGRLWFAWKIVLLQYHKQPYVEKQGCVFGCDLLEKSYFCSITNNQRQAGQLIKMVVICLKNRTFAVSQTTCFCCFE